MNCSLYVAVILVVAGAAEGRQKCHGSPSQYNGKLCASTTWYHDGMQGACGCGDNDLDTQFNWSRSKYTAAANQYFFDVGLKGWCGENCGVCVNLTTTGGAAPGGENTAEGQSHVFMIVDLCPNIAPNSNWCSQTASHPVNHFGYGAHFDLEDGAHQISQGLRWDNVEVTYEVVDCDQAHSQGNRTPSTTSHYNQCVCHKESIVG